MEDRVKEPVAVVDFTGKRERFLSEARLKKDWELANILRSKFIEIVNDEATGEKIPFELQADYSSNKQILLERNKDLLAIISSTDDFNEGTAVPDFEMSEELTEEELVDSVLKGESFLIEKVPGINSNEKARELVRRVFEKEKARYLRDIETWNRMRILIRRTYSYEFKNASEKLKLEIEKRAELLTWQINEVKKVKQKAV